MGYAGKLAEKKRARGLRRRGWSYSEIRKKVLVSKDTLSRWCREIILSSSQLERLAKRKITGGERGRLLGAKKQQLARARRTSFLLKEGKRAIGKLKGREKFLVGLGLYLGDGLKGDREVGFSNSNWEIIRFMMGWFREFCAVPEEKFRGQIWIHENLDEAAARSYWAKVTGINLKQFYKSYIARDKKDSLKIRKNLHERGVFAIRISSSSIQRKIRGWMAE